MEPPPVQVAPGGVVSRQLLGGAGSEGGSRCEEEKDVEPMLMSQKTRLLHCGVKGEKLEVS